MENLFIETGSDTVPVSQDIIKKYNLEKGTFTPFTDFRIVGKNNDFRKEQPPEETPSFKNEDDEVEEMENGLMLSTSEMIDIAQGSDSYPDSNNY